MNSHCPRPFPRPFGSMVCCALGWAVFAGPVVAYGQSARKNPASKLYVSDVGGEAIIDTGEVVEDIRKRSIYTAEGTVIETKKPSNESDRQKYFSTVVYSNGTGAFFDADTRVEFKRFVQEPFTPNRTDAEVEPSISQTQAFVARGTVGLCNSKLVAGSSMNYQTPHGSVNIRGRKIVIEAKDDVTKISMLEGDSTVRGGAQDLGGQNLLAGQQAIIRRGAAGERPQVIIQPIPEREKSALDEKVTMACMAKKTVYFEQQERQETGDRKSGENQIAGTGDDAAGADGGGPNGLVTAFDGGSGNSSSVTIREIVPVPVVPATLPTEHVVSPARLVTPSGGPGG